MDFFFNSLNLSRFTIFLFPFSVFWEISREIYPSKASWELCFVDVVYSASKFIFIHSSRASFERESNKSSTAKIHARLSSVYKR